MHSGHPSSLILVSPLFLVSYMEVLTDDILSMHVCIFFSVPLLLLHLYVHIILLQGFSLSFLEVPHIEGSSTCIKSTGDKVGMAVS